MSTTHCGNKYSIVVHYNMNSGYPEFFSETFGAVLDLQTPFFTEIDDPHSRQPFHNMFPT